VTTIWVNKGLPQRVPHRFRAWFHHGLNGYREGPLQGFDIPAVVVNAAPGKGAANPLDRVVEDLKPLEPVEVEFEGSANVFD